MYTDACTCTHPTTGPIHPPTPPPVHTRVHTQHAVQLLAVDASMSNACSSATSSRNMQAVDMHAVARNVDASMMSCRTCFVRSCFGPSTAVCQ